MELTALGFDDWFKNHATDVLGEGDSIARVIAIDKGAYLIRGSGIDCYAALSGTFRFQAQSSIDIPCVGDWVCVRGASSEGSAIIYHLLPRKTFLRRKRPRSTDYQMIVANVDVAFIIQGCQFDFNIARLERYLVMIRDGQIEPRVVLSKTDLISADELEVKVEAVGASGASIPVLPLSNITGCGLSEFGEHLKPGITYCLLGSSGVGKTTLLNRIMGYEAFETKAVSSLGKGAHTSIRRHLTVLENGAMVIDTPGMRELGLMGADDGVSQGFDEFTQISVNCRYADCTHQHEPGCAVLAAVDSGELPGDRYASYIKLKKESEHCQTSYQDRRHKDKAFGKHVKQAKKKFGRRR